MHKESSKTDTDNPTSLLPLPAIWFRQDSDMLYSNRLFCEFTGTPEAMPFQELLKKWIHPADVGLLKPLLAKPPKKEKKLYYRLKNQHGHFRWHCHNCKPYQAEGKPAGYLNLFQDIHELYAGAPESMDRFQQIFNETFQFTALLDTEGRLLEANRSAMEFGGYQLEEVKGQYFWKAGWWKNSQEEHHRLFRAVKEAAQGAFFRSEEKVYSPEGREFTVDFSLKPVFSPDGTISQLIAEGRDVTELQLVRDQLRDSEIRWRTLVENTPDIITRHNTSLEYTYVNPAVEPLTGLAPTHFIGKKPDQVLLPQATTQRYFQALQKALQKKETQDYSIEMPDQKGRLVHLFISVTPELNDQQEVESLLVLSRDITELKEKEALLSKADKELMLSGAKLRNILDSTKEVICACDSRLNLMAFNQAFEKECFKLYGKTPKTGQALEELLIHMPMEKSSLVHLWQRAVRGEEFTILQEFGDETLQRNYYETTFNPIKDKQGRIMGATALSRDLTKERKIEKELKDAREFLILAENMPQIVFTTGPDGIPDYLNQAFYEYTGLSGQETKSFFGELFIHPEDLKPLRQGWINAVKNKEGMQQEVRLRYHSGVFRWNLIRFLPLSTGLEEVSKWIGSATDIHEAKTAEEQQRMSAREFRQLSESLPQIIWTADPKGTLDYLNSKWYEYTGELPARFNKENWASFIHPNEQAQSQQTWDLSIRQKEAYQAEYRLRNHKGQYRWFLAKAVPLLNQEEKVVKWFGSATDIHDQKLQNEQLWQQNAQLNQINEYLDSFVHSAAHDLRAPIANIKGLLSLIDDAPEEKKKKIIQNLKFTSERMDTTLQGMIQLIEAQNQIASISRDLPIRALFLEIISEFSEELAEIEYQVIINIPDSDRINFVQAYLKSIFRNLISNSIKYRKKNQKLVLRLSCLQEEGFHLLTYQDNGIGIDMERFGKKMFRPFRRFTTQSSGKGIGMHIVKNMLIKTGGDIQVESAPGKGTTFRLKLKDQPEVQEKGS